MGRLGRNYLSTKVSRKCNNLYIVYFILLPHKAAVFVCNLIQSTKWRPVVILTNTTHYIFIDVLSFL